jgi:hypothetical protein
MSYMFTVINTYEGVGVLKIEQSESEVLCTNSRALPTRQKIREVPSDWMVAVYV